MDYVVLVQMHQRLGGLAQNEGNVLFGDLAIRCVQTIDQLDGRTTFAVLENMLKKYNGFKVSPKNQIPYFWKLLKR